MKTTPSKSEKRQSQGRPKLGDKAKSEAVRVRLHPDEKEAFTRLAQTLGTKPAELHRHLIREAVSSGPEILEAELKALLEANAGLSAIGRNINQIARAVNQGSIVVEPIVKEDLESVLAELEKHKIALRRFVKRARSRRVKV